VVNTGEKAGGFRVEVSQRVALAGSSLPSFLARHKIFQAKFPFPLAKPTGDCR
jgi:hypothetical protein